MYAKCSGKPVNERCRDPVALKWKQLMLAAVEMDGVGIQQEWKSGAPDTVRNLAW